MKNIRAIYDILSSAILSGICISIGCIVYLKVGGVLGAVLFSFGLITVTHYKWMLYTGQCGFIQCWYDIGNLILTLIGNIIGCVLTSFIMKYSQPILLENAISVINNRFSLDIISCGLMAIGCGFIMTVAVCFSRQNKFLPLLFGVPVFILCGFLHSIADAFYISMLPYNFIENNLSQILKYYGVIVLGNFIGCNLIRIIKINRYYE